MVIYIYIYVYVCIYVCVYIYIYIYIEKEYGSAATASEGRLSLPCALFVLREVLDICARSRILVEPLAAVLLWPRLPAKIAGICSGPLPPNPPTYRATTPDVSGRPPAWKPPPPPAEGAAGTAERADPDGLESAWLRFNITIIITTISNSNRYA